MAYIEKEWQIASGAPEEFKNKIPQYDPLILQLLHNRDISKKEEIDKFFSPDYDRDLFDPFLFTDMEKAVKRIEKAVEKNERVAIYGDYDADGVTSSVVLTELFKEVLGLSGQIYIPDRKSEGYGMNKKAIDWLIKKKINLIVTCDCGVSNREEIDYAKSKGVDTMVFDHHCLPEEFSDDYIVVDAKRKGDKYPYKELSAVGVVFKFARAIFKSGLLSKVKTEYKNNEKLFKEFEKNLLDLVTLGTIADCSPLTSENRVLIKYGLDVVKNTKRVGMICLKKQARINQNNLDTMGVGFYIAPRVNAAGRLDHANVAYKLLATNSYSIAKVLSYQLEMTNRKRQKLTGEIVKEAKEELKGDLENKKVLIAGNSKWPLGVLGIVASKICDEYFRPALIMSLGEKESSGSARSIPRFNMIEAISSCRDLLLEYGGHKGAAGFSLENKNISKFTKCLNEIANDKLLKKDLVPKINIDAEIELTEINQEFYEKIKKFEPFGIGNQKPIFCARNVQILNLTRIGKASNHIKLNVIDQSGNKKIDIVGFNFNGRIKEMGNIIDIAFEVDENEWNGRKTLQLVLVDFKRAR